LSFPPPATALPLLLLLCLLHSSLLTWTVESELIYSPLFTLHVNSGEQLTTGLRRFHRQPLLFLFPFSFSFVFCILHCSREQWRMHPLLWLNRVRSKLKYPVSWSNPVK
jgi:hypothetical protein